MFIRQLVQMQQVTAQKAFAIAEMYPTLADLMAAYDRVAVQGNFIWLGR
jgi:hypothetical protein